jgi:hypothetical protein
VSSDVRVGVEFAGHRIEEVAGAGGMGIVYRATHLLLQRTVALKLIAPGMARNAAFRSRFEREWRMLAGLDHPNVIPIYEAGEVDDQPYLSMRWVAGGDLSQRLRGTAGLEPAIALDILGQVAAALDAAHERGVIHRDIKPGNVLIEGERVWLTDFGAGKDLGARDTLTATGKWVGTVDYVAPELLDGKTATARSDVYSLGCLLFESLTGHVPFPRETDVATLWAHRFEPPPSTSELRSSLPHRLDDVLRRALAKEPDERPASAGELIRAARAATARVPPGRPTVVHEEEELAPAPRRRARMLGAAAAAIVLLAAGVAAGIAFGPSDDVEPVIPAALLSKAPRIERVDLGSNVTTGKVIIAGPLVLVGDGPNNRVIAVIQSSRQVLRRVKLRYPPHDMDTTRDGKHVWIALEEGWVADLDLSDWKVTYAKADVNGSRIAVTEKYVVVLTSSDDGGFLQRIDPKTHRKVGKAVEAGGAPSDLDADFENVLEMTALPPTLTDWEPDLSNHNDVKIPIDGVPADLQNDPPWAWVTDFQDDVLVRFDALDGKRLAMISMPDKPDGIAEDGDILWIATQSGFIQRVNRKTNKKVGPVIDPGPLTGDIQAQLGVAWAAGPSYLVRIEPRA